MLDWIEIEARASEFQSRWRNCEGNERQDGSTFIKDLMNVFGVDFRDGLLEHQIRDHEGRIGYIDYLLPGKILIEMKSKGESLIRAYNQAIDYTRSLSPEDYPELLLVSNFTSFQLTNLRTGQKYNDFRLGGLKRRLRMFGIVAGYTSETDFETSIEVNIKASEKMADLHDALKEEGYSGQDLEIYLVRLLFCLFAEDTGIFEQRSFETYLRESNEDGSDLSPRLMQLFDILNTPEENRIPALQDRFRSFRYINGHLFADHLPSAHFDTSMRRILIECCNFDWSYISPAIFGAMFQGVMDPETRRELGAHYTSEENIMKVIKPLFLDTLWDEFERAKTTVNELQAFHTRISELTFLDPACGCGNFLLIAYRELRLLEFEILKLVYPQRAGAMTVAITRVTIDQFFGIEYEDFPVQVAQLSLILMKHQMDQLVSDYYRWNTIDFPIKEQATIIHGNALTLDWAEVINPEDLDYIIGNPPFVGKAFQSPEQKTDMRSVFGKNIRSGNLDYVTAWFMKAARLMHGHRHIQSSFVATNSISQGEQVAALWIPLRDLGMEIIFAYQTFKWSNEARGRAAVHCVIIGFSHRSRLTAKPILLFDSDAKGKVVDSISPYLFAGSFIIVQPRSRPLAKIKPMMFGNMPNDGGNLILSPDEKDQLELAHPKASKWIRPFVGAKEFIQGHERYCLWLTSNDVREALQIPEIRERAEGVRTHRLTSSRTTTQELANVPYRFGEIRHPESGNYIIVPGVSSELRVYVPMGILSNQTVASNAVFIVPDASYYEFAIINSYAHMAWMRFTSGRLESRYRYSKDLVYNTFPWPSPSDGQKSKIEQTGKNILEARSHFPDWTLAELYDDLMMPIELRQAHQENDAAVEDAYGTSWSSESACVEDLLRRYQLLINGLN